jgi:hypothetical protein
MANKEQEIVTPDISIDGDVSIEVDATTENREQQNTLNLQLLQSINKQLKEINKTLKKIYQ